VLKQAGIPFEEERISLDAPDFKARVSAYSGAGKVPVLIDGGLVVWDSLAIASYAAERHPDKRLWPQDRAARAVALAACAEMHAGFASLRSRMPMNVTAVLPGMGWDLTVQRDIDRIAALWADLRRRYGSGGPLLFGEFTIADAFFAPVVFRFNTYRPALPAVASEYMQSMLQLPAMQAWRAQAAAETEFLDEDEPYRRRPG
jgi:glutathione S-transferase